MLNHLVVANGYYSTMEMAVVQGTDFMGKTKIIISLEISTEWNFSVQD